MGRRGSAGAWVEGAGVCEGSKSCIIGFVAQLKKTLKALKDFMGFQCMLRWSCDDTYEYDICREAKCFFCVPLNFQPRQPCFLLAMFWTNLSPQDERYYEQPIPRRTPSNKRYPTTRGRKSTCLLYTSPSPRDQRGSRMPSSA